MKELKLEVCFLAIKDVMRICYWVANQKARVSTSHFQRAVNAAWFELEVGWR